MRGLAALALVVALPAAAQEVPPDYFVASAFETSTAQVLALNCEALSIDPVALAAATDPVLDRLTADGYTAENIAERMADPSSAIAALQAEFLSYHALADGAPEAQVCAAGRAEIARGSGIGKLLIDLTDREATE